MGEDASKLTASVIERDVCFFRGVLLDKMTETGPRGGRKIWWRAASQRDTWCAAWSPTREQAAKGMPIGH